MIGIMLLSVAAIGAVFVAVREITANFSSKDPLYYLTFYAGSPTAVLNQMWEEPIVRPDIFGQKTLFYFNRTINFFFGFPERYNFYYDYMRSPNGTLIGNAPTAFRPAYVEFGMWGFLLFFIIMGAFFTVLYCRCRRRKGGSPIDFRLLVYAYISYVFFMYFYSTFFDFFSHVFFIKYIIELLLIRWFLVGWDFKRRVRFSFGKKHGAPALRE